MKRSPKPSGPSPAQRLYAEYFDGPASPDFLEAVSRPLTSADEREAEEERAEDERVRQSGDIGAMLRHLHIDDIAGVSSRDLYAARDGVPVAPAVDRTIRAAINAAWAHNDEQRSRPEPRIQLTEAERHRVWEWRVGKPISLDPSTCWDVAGDRGLARALAVSARTVERRIEDGELYALAAPTAGGSGQRRGRWLVPDAVARHAIRLAASERLQRIAAANPTNKPRESTLVEEDNWHAGLDDDQPYIGGEHEHLIQPEGNWRDHRAMKTDLAIVSSFVRSRSGLTEQERRAAIDWYQKHATELPQIKTVPPRQRSGKR